MIRSKPVLTFVSLIALTLSYAHRDSTTVESVIKEGRDSSQAKAILVELCETVGPRTTGTPQCRAAEEWALKKFKSFGVDSAWLEKWGETPQGFERGARQVGRMVSPTRKEFVFTTNNFTVGTDGPVRGRAVRHPETLGDIEVLKDALKGAWVLMPAAVNMGGPGMRQRGALDRALDGAGIAGRIYTTNGELVWTSGRWNDYTDETRPKTPMIAVRAEDYEAVVKAMEGGGAPQLEFDIENKFIDEAIPFHNVVAEIRGVEKPDEVVILCAHLDSWNGPGSKGAQDNGTGVSAVLEAARILAKSGAKPKRTIRFILWTGEEQGLLGSRAYVEAHRAEMAKVSAVLNEDSGGNYHSRMSGTADMIEALKAAAAPMKDAFPGKPVEVVEIRQFSRGGGGSDHASFIAADVPGFTFGKSGGISYRHSWHTQNDTPDLVPADHVAQMATNMAVIGYNLANAEALLPRLPR